MSDYEKDIERGLIAYLASLGIKAVQAELNESEVEKAYFEGCETCGYGADDDRIYTRISYKTEDRNYWQCHEIPGTSLDFLPTLLKFIDESK